MSLSKGLSKIVQDTSKVFAVGAYYDFSQRVWFWEGDETKIDSKFWRTKADDKQFRGPGSKSGFHYY